MEIAIILALIVSLGVNIKLANDNKALRQKLQDIEEQEVLVEKMRGVGKYIKGNQA